MFQACSPNVRSASTAKHSPNISADNVLITFLQRFPNIVQKHSDNIYESPQDPSLANITCNIQNNTNVCTMFCEYQLPTWGRVQPSLKQRLCVPKAYRFEILKRYHDRLGHFANERVYLRMAPLVFWKDLYKDVKDYTRTCDLCLRAKSNFSAKKQRLWYAK